MAYERFWKRVNTAGNCWLWEGAQTRGYGQLTHDRRHHYAHRFSWQITRGEIPEGMVVCHRCDTPLCVNPDHLFLATQLDNVRDCISKGRSRRRGIPGAANPAVKNASVDAERITSLFHLGLGVREIAPIVGVSKSTVSNVIRGKHWSTRNG